ncbi:transmembrane protein, putative (macronuclear) [Tetrahymena thermophila SB210]|uniref:Transmembrane protein, putative n=1 Tax=Tetrahymena thermophila (strain SB210) TaxID=312017 RepID=W7XCY7_TETTS|nr:transmembrane protein, putative [Tetrahymena thermophila SB210]EWS74458.1 transmembrane protein, putative [Tetrahymena thermophila SB210]|eukprot:XP_012653035.1 transmembrane protein, putative [Tetrahymena thermophila SB210]
MLKPKICIYSFKYKKKQVIKLVSLFVWQFAWILKLEPHYIHQYKHTKCYKINNEKILLFHSNKFFYNFTCKFSLKKFAFFCSFISLFIIYFLINLLVSFFVCFFIYLDKFHTLKTSKTSVNFIITKTCLDKFVEIIYSFQTQKDKHTLRE